MTINNLFINYVDISARKKYYIFIDFNINKAGENMSEKYILGVDGGGTKIRFSR